MRLQLGTTQGKRAWAEPKELGKQREYWKSWVMLRRVFIDDGWRCDNVYF